jgi:enoyl-CoA hydratase/carnithine racemase
LRKKIIPPKCPIRETAMNEPPLLLRADDQGVVTLTLNRPQSRNGLSLALLQALGAVLDAIDADAGARVVVIAGAGPAFCAGHDLKELRAKKFDPGYVDQLFAVRAFLDKRPPVWTGT